ncbi:MAG TPA: PAS domain-containing protein [Candidatus Methylomirabilis sp.]|nr:PAS domain-containing protein [Candidatus Methylomirabilis sp.]
MNTTVRAISGAAIYRWHLEERRYVYVNPEIAGITGVLVQDLELTGREQLMARIHPEDRARVEAEVEAVLGGGRATVFYRFLWRDGTYRVLMEHMYATREGEGRTFLAGMLEDVTDELSAVPAPVACRGGLGAGETIGVPGRSSLKGKVAAGVGIAVLLVLALGTGYVTGLRQATWSRATPALSANVPGGLQVATRASRPATAASPHGTNATEHARLIKARAANPQRGLRTLRHRAAAAPSAQAGVATSQAARPSFWSRVAQVPQPMAPDPPSVH